MRSTIFVKVVLIVIVLYLLSVIESARLTFREDYRYEKAFNAFYKLHNEGLSWHEARIRCEAEGSELVVPETLDEADSLMLVITPILTKFQGVFIGIHDLYSEQSFVTIHGDSFHNTILDLLWERQQPQYNGGRCVAMRRNGKMFVHPCSGPLPFVCKIKVAKIAHYPDCSTYDGRWVLGPNSTCYMTHFEQQTWKEAYATCQLAGGHLAIINSRNETHHIRNLFKNIEQSRDSTSDDFAFLGFSDLFERYHYRTIFGDRLFAKADWDFKCSGVETMGTEERCGGIRRSGFLTTGPCDVPAIFFCEKPVVSHSIIEPEAK